jgi:hypothetical protein
MYVLPNRNVEHVLLQTPGPSSAALGDMGGEVSKIYDWHYSFILLRHSLKISGNISSKGFSDPHL